MRNTATAWENPAEKWLAYSIQLRRVREEKRSLTIQADLKER